MIANSLTLKGAVEYLFYLFFRLFHQRWLFFFHFLKQCLEAHLAYCFKGFYESN